MNVCVSIPSTEAAGTSQVPGEENREPRGPKLFKGWIEEKQAK